VLAEDAIKAAIQNFKEKNGGESATGKTHAAVAV
jgi:hypothetical protein